MMKILKSQIDTNSENVLRKDSLKVEHIFYNKNVELYNKNRILTNCWQNKDSVKEDWLLTNGLFNRKKFVFINFSWSWGRHFENIKWGIALCTRNTRTVGKTDRRTLEPIKQWSFRKKLGIK